MRPVITLVPTLPWHVQYVAQHARAPDVAEFLAGSGQSPLQVIEYGLRASACVYTGLVDGVPVAVLGVSPASALSGIGCPWMVATDGVDAIAHRLIRISRPVIDAMHTLFPVLVNFVDNRNVKAHAWLRWLGFQLHDPAPHGREGRPFRLFVRVSHV